MYCTSLIIKSDDVLHLIFQEGLMIFWTQVSKITTNSFCTFPRSVLRNIVYGLRILWTRYTRNPVYASRVSEKHILYLIICKTVLTVNGTCFCKDPFIVTNSTCILMYMERGMMCSVVSVIQHDEVPSSVTSYQSVVAYYHLPIISPNNQLKINTPHYPKLLGRLTSTSFITPLYIISGHIFCLTTYLRFLSLCSPPSSPFSVLSHYLPASFLFLLNSASRCP